MLLSIRYPSIYDELLYCRGGPIVSLLHFNYHRYRYHRYYRHRRFFCIARFQLLLCRRYYLNYYYYLHYHHKHGHHYYQYSVMYATSNWIT